MVSPETRRTLQAFVLLAMLSVAEGRRVSSRILLSGSQSDGSAFNVDGGVTESVYNGPENEEGPGGNPVMERLDEENILVDHGLVTEAATAMQDVMEEMSRAQRICWPCWMPAHACSSLHETSPRWRGCWRSQKPCWSTSVGCRMSSPRLQRRSLIRRRRRSRRPRLRRAARSRRPWGTFSQTRRCSSCWKIWRRWSR